MLDNETITARHAALVAAKEFVLPIVETYTPEAYEVITMPAVVFSTPPRYTVTPAEQIVNLIKDVATWLLNEES